MFHHKTINISCYYNNKKTRSKTRRAVKTSSLPRHLRKLLDVRKMPSKVTSFFFRRTKYIIGRTHSWRFSTFYKSVVLTFISKQLRSLPSVKGQEVNTRRAVKTSSLARLHLIIGIYSSSKIITWYIFFLNQLSSQIGLGFYYYCSICLLYTSPSPRD